MAKFCTKCGARHEDAANFCASCGTRFPEAGQPIQQIPQPAAPAFVPPVGQPPVPQPAGQYGQPAPPPGYQPAQQSVAFIEKQKVLYDAPYALNRPDQPWQATVEGDAIVARWKWMDATFFAPHEVTNETRDYAFTVTLSDKGTWRELDRAENSSSGMKASGGKVTFGSSSSTFIGKQNKKSFQFGAGKNNQTGETGLIGFKFNTTAVKEPIRGYLTACGWKMAGPFG